MDINIWVCTILAFIHKLAASANQGNGGETRYKMVDPDADQGNLTCYSCYVNVHGNSCLSLEDKIQAQHFQDPCNAGEYYCKVRRFTQDKKLEIFERSCAKECTPGCDVTYETFPIENCFSCCRTDLCNTDNSSSFISMATTTLLLLQFLYCVFKI